MDDDPIYSVEPRKLWEHEDHLINQRITWLGVSQGLLFAAYGVVLREKNNPEVMDSIHEMLLLIPTVGFLVSFLVLFGTIAAGWAMLKIRRKFNKEEKEIHWLGVSPITTGMGLVTAWGIPLVFLGAWGFLLNNALQVT